MYNRNKCHCIKLWMMLLQLLLIMLFIDWNHNNIRFINSYIIISNKQQLSVMRKTTTTKTTTSCKIPITTHRTNNRFTIRRRRRQQQQQQQQQQRNNLHHTTLLLQRQNHLLSTTSLSLSKSDNNYDNDITDDVDPSILISSKSDIIQQFVFVGLFILLGIGTNICINLWNGYGINYLGIAFYNDIRTIIFPILFGIIFTIVGITHFIFDTNFIRIVPPKGTWGGLWQAPTPGINYIPISISYEQYHCYWTGIIESCGGIWLLLSTLYHITPIEIPSMLLFILTIGVTPANIYMFTHNANPGGNIPKLNYPYGHIGRFIIQCGLLSNFWIMSHNPPLSS